MITLQSITLPSKAKVFVSPSTILVSTRPQVMQGEGGELMSARSLKVWEQLQRIELEFDGDKDFDVRDQAQSNQNKKKYFKYYSHTAI
jgi:hypothetical protein